MQGVVSLRFCVNRGGKAEGAKLLQVISELEDTNVTADRKAESQIELSDHGERVVRPKSYAAENKFERFDVARTIKFPISWMLRAPTLRRHHLESPWPPRHFVHSTHGFNRYIQQEAAPQPGVIARCTRQDWG